MPVIIILLLKVIFLFAFRAPSNSPLAYRCEKEVLRVAFAIEDFHPLMGSVEIEPKRLVRLSFLVS